MKRSGLPITLTLLSLSLNHVNAGDSFPCKDTVSRFNVGNTLTSCDWAKRKDTIERCKSEKMRNKCPKTCSLCSVNDSSNKKMKKNKKKQMRNKKNKTCDWAKKRDTINRCNIQEVKKKCKELCSDPSSSVCQVMKGEKGRFRVDDGTKNNASKSCSWAVEKDVKNRCMIKEVKKNCATTCEVCMQFKSEQEVDSGDNDTSEIRSIDEPKCQNSNIKFEVTLSVVDNVATTKRKDCVWARKNFESGSCLYTEVKSNCPKLCDACGSSEVASINTPTTAIAATKTPTIPPTVIPTSTPTVTPTDTPTTIAPQTESPTLPPTSSTTISPTPIATVEVTANGSVGNSFNNDTIITSISGGNHEEPTIEVISEGYRYMTRKSPIGISVIPFSIALALSIL